MLFSIDEDSGARVIGWVMPNHPSSTPRIRAYFNDEQKHVVEAQIFRPLLKEQGLHNTGICGFVLDENTCSGISTAEVLSLYDDETNTLIYQRRPTGPLFEFKLLRVETQLLRLTPVDDVFKPRFHMTYLGLESIPDETTTSIFGIPFTSSIYAAGRIHYHNFSALLHDRGFKTVILLRDPYEELAERLLILKLAKTPAAGGSVKLLGQAILGALHIVRDVDFSTVEGVDRAVDRIDDVSRPLLQNSLARQLSTKSDDDPLDPMAVGTALDTLSEFDLVGMRSNWRSFAEMFGAVMGIDPQLPDAKLESYRSVQDLADVLRASAKVSDLIGMDMEIYEAVSRATENATKEAVG